MSALESAMLRDLRETNRRNRRSTWRTWLVLLSDGRLRHEYHRKQVEFASGRRCSNREKLLSSFIDNVLSSTRREPPLIPGEKFSRIVLAGAGATSTSSHKITARSQSYQCVRVCVPKQYNNSEIFSRVFLFSFVREFRVASVYCKFEKSI